MNKRDAKKIAETITNEELAEMLWNAKAGIKNWTKVSNCNKGLSKGVAWNVLARDFDVNKKHHILAKTNMVREFGEYLPDHLKPEKKNRAKNKSEDIIHHSPDFKNWK